MSGVGSPDRPPEKFFGDARSASVAQVNLTPVETLRSCLVWLAASGEDIPTREAKAREGAAALDALVDAVEAAQRVEQHAQETAVYYLPLAKALDELIAALSVFSTDDPDNEHLGASEARRSAGDS